ncbi:MAG TPA: hypothetical protein VE093_40315 [Polyangiaceae bacterium]|jgi:hypothetical protein|nr:hypothetical protein [Polyangiaceae bacterium]
MKSLRAAAPFFAALAALTALALAPPGCSSDRDLGVDPPTGPSSSSSAGGGAGGSGVGGGGVGGSGTGGDIPEPPGPTALTIVNGVNDYDAIRLCFVPYPDGDGAAEEPWPSDAAGLAFAGSRVVSPIAPVIPGGSDIRTFVIAGDLAKTSGKTCAEVFAMAASGGGSGGAGGAGGAGGGDPGVLVAPLAVLPAAVFESERSLLLVPTGCVGGPGHTDPTETLACGAAYTPDSPTASLVALGMSRIANPNRVNLQVVHAAVALPEVDFRIKPDEKPEWAVASSLSIGAIGPKPPFDSLQAIAYGDIFQAQLLTYLPSSVNPTSKTGMLEVFSKSPVALGDFKDGASLVLVAVGSAPGQPAGPFWHKLTYAMVRASP